MSSTAVIEGKGLTSVVQKSFMITSLGSADGQSSALVIYLELQLQPQLAEGTVTSPW